MGSTTVTITITDVNNKSPVFIPDRRSVTLLENADIGHRFYTYTATDSDDTASLSYSLVKDKVRGENEDKLLVTDKEYLAVSF